MEEGGGSTLMPLVFSFEFAIKSFKLQSHLSPSSSSSQPR
jgi:hypothetical protein